MINLTGSAQGGLLSLQSNMAKFSCWFLSGWLHKDWVFQSLSNFRSQAHSCRMPLSFSLLSEDPCNDFTDAQALNVSDFNQIFSA